jgi:flagellar P-ring protein precursor FlgI
MTRAAALAALLLLAPTPPVEAATRIKDVVSVLGVRANQLVGYGLVIGLNGTGDTLRNSPFTEQSLQSMLDRMGINVRTVRPRTRNVAAVIVTAELPPFISRGSRIDVHVSSLGDATSLVGGSLVLTPLSGPDQQIYAVAQGQVVVNGFSQQGQSERLTQNVPTAARIANGALVEREPPGAFGDERPLSYGNRGLAQGGAGDRLGARDLKNTLIETRDPQAGSSARRSAQARSRDAGSGIGDDGLIALELRNPDFSTAVRVADAINTYTREHYGTDAARERDLRTVILRKPVEVNAARFLAEITELPVEPDAPARVVIDERTGTIVIGRDVQISTVAVAHGNLTVRVTENLTVAQPNPFAEGETVVVPETVVTADQEGGNVAIVPGANLQTLVAGLNRMGLKPNSIIAILQAIKSAGALQADLVVQ